jgi:uncharacterized protein
MLTLARICDDIGSSSRLAFFMFWETLWPLVLGFTLSGAVQAFVSTDQVERAMHGHGPKTILRASVFGMVSSSCSYAATATAKSLFQKGADLVSSMVYMFASTNLVIELGIVLVVLLGWRFAAAEAVGGAVMIALLAITGGLVLREVIVDRARQRLREQDNGWNRQEAPISRPGSKNLVSHDRWALGARYAITDFKMLRRELLGGYTVAGVLTALVPADVWNALFAHGHGIWTSLENAFVGPFIAILSFVCSIGNVPLAAALWKGGISFGGVISFLFADLITFPLLLIYRKYYGNRLAVRLLVLFWSLMTLAGLIVNGLFSVAGIRPVDRPGRVVTTTFGSGYTTPLNVAFLAFAALLYWLYRRQLRSEDDRVSAVEPACCEHSSISSP